jgi:hypothetical protein
MLNGSSREIKHQVISKLECTSFAGETGDLKVEGPSNELTIFHGLYCSFPGCSFSASCRGPVLPGKGVIVSVYIMWMLMHGQLGAFDSRDILICRCRPVGVTLVRV